MLDCRRVSVLILRFPDSRQADLVLNQGVHAIGRDPQGLPGPVADTPAAVAQFCVDRRGVWLQLRDGAQGVHVNGRPVRRMAMLRAGDSVYLDGAELLLLGSEPAAGGAGGGEGDPRVVLRGIGGPNHGRCFGLDTELVVVRLPDGDLSVGPSAGGPDSVGDVRARLRPCSAGVELHGAADAACQVNGWPVDQALLRPCDQLLLDGQHRFVVEAPMCAPAGSEAAQAVGERLLVEEAEADDGRDTVKASARRVPWLLLAALLLAAALSLLLLYGAR